MIAIRHKTAPLIVVNASERWLPINFATHSPIRIRFKRGQTLSDWDAVRATPLFAAMSEVNFRTLRDTAVVNRLPKNAPVGKQGERVLHVLVEGSVELYGSHDGQTATIDVKEPVTALNLASIIRGAAAVEQARTVSAARTLAIPAEAIRDAFRRDVAFAQAVAAEVADSYRDVMRLLMNEKLRTSVERLAAWIVQSCTVNGNNQASVELKFNKRILASRLGMAPENLSRNLALLERYGVRSAGRGIMVDDLRRLEEFAKPSPVIDVPRVNSHDDLEAAC
jgi:CRP/FNR family transcriptional activator FtrB